MPSSSEKPPQGPEGTWQRPSDSCGKTTSKLEFRTVRQARGRKERHFQRCVAAGSPLLGKPLEDTLRQEEGVNPQKGEPGSLGGAVHGSHVHLPHCAMSADGMKTENSELVR